MTPLGIMITNGGAHTPDKWAMASAMRLSSALFGTTQAPTISARKFEMLIIDILLDAHTKMQEHERGRIKEFGTERLERALDPTKYLVDPVKKIVDAAKAVGIVEIPDPSNPGKMKTVDLGQHLSTPEAAAALAQVVGQDLASVVDIERSILAGVDHDDPESAAYRRARRNFGPARVSQTIHHYRPGGSLDRPPAKAAPAVGDRSKA